jgi:hypothetical protein
MGLSFTIAAGPRQCSHSQVRVPRNHIFLSQIRDFPNLEGQVPVFISPRNRVARLYPQALGSLFIPSYNSQGYGGVIRPRLHTGSARLLLGWCPCYTNPWHGPRRKPFLKIPLLFAWTRCRGNLFVSRSLPNKGSTRYYIYESTLGKNPAASIFRQV